MEKILYLINRNISLRMMLFLSTLVLMFACSKEQGLIDDPYGGGEVPLGINIPEDAPTPLKGTIGDVITYKATGLVPYKDKIKCFFNETPAEVVSVTDNNISIMIPEGASTGGMSLVIDDQIFFGPAVSVVGKTNIDRTFSPGIGADFLINQVTPAGNGNYILVGAFSNYQNKGTKNKPLNGIALINARGEHVNTFDAGLGPNGHLTSIIKLRNGQFVIAGKFNRYNEIAGINNITKINANGSLDSKVVTVVNLTPLEPENSYDTVATFNGGSYTGGPSKIFAAQDNKIIAIGSFSFYADYFYERSTRDAKILGLTKMDRLFRVHEDGRLDSSYNFNHATGESYEGGNGYILDGFLQSDDKLVVVGNFTNLQGMVANRIVRLKADGTVDPEFNAGTGANGEISTIRFNAATEKYVISGSFSTYNGQPANGVALLNADGSLDESFKMKAISGGKVNFAAQLKSGLFIVSGSFNKYDNIVRQGFVILNPDGSLAKEYNNTGKFEGLISDIHETTSPLGLPAVLMVGLISKFDGKDANNIVQITIEP